MLERAGRLPQRVIACVGGGSNSIGMFVPFVDDSEVELVGVEAAGEGIDTGRHGAPLTAGGLPGVLHGAYSAIMQDEDGQILEAHSISAGLDYPGSGSGARLAARLRARALRRGHRRAGTRGVCADCAARGDHPGTGERPRDRLGAIRGPERARPRLPVGPRRQGPRRGARAPARARMSGVERIAEAFASARANGRRAALMPYLMGGFPDLETSRRDRARLRARPAPT